MHAARIGFTASAVLDAAWADARACQRGESPLACEFRLTRPSLAFISLGTNDSHWEVTEIYLRILRERVKGDRVWWILPQPRFVNARNAVLMVADTYGDQVLEVPAKILERDKIHPTAAGYKQLADQTKK